MAIIKRFATEDYVSEKNSIINEQLESVKNNTVLFTPQTLTEAQKAQARKNLGLVDNNTQVSNGTNPVTTEYIYRYDGDTNSDTNTWIYNYGGIKSFVKLGDVPEGELNLVGATIFRTNPSNTWLDKTVTITEEHLTKVLHKANTDIPAVQDGLIQIFDIMNSDFSEFTILCICTIPGWYNVTFDDWYEIINFPEPGIYGYDKRTYGGNDYLKTFTFSATASSQNPGGSGGAGNNTVTTPIKYTGNEIQMFSRGICIGDSVTEGSFDNDQDGAIVKRFSYPAILKRITNIDIANAGIAGMTSQTWYEASLNSDSQWGKWVNDEWVWNMNPQVTSADTISTALDYSNFDFAIIHLGINDFGLMGDITLDEMAANFVTNMMNIISRLKTDSPGIKIFVATIVPSYAPAHHVGYNLLNEKITDIANTNDDVYLLDLNTYSELATNENYNVIHPTALGYHKLANEIASYISYIIKKNLDEFNSVQFIGMN